MFRLMATKEVTKMRDKMYVKNLGANRGTRIRRMKMIPRIQSPFK